MVKYLCFFVVTVEFKAASVVAVVMREGHVFWAIWNGQRPSYEKKQSKRSHWKHMKIAKSHISIPISEGFLKMLALRFL